MLSIKSYMAFTPSPHDKGDERLNHYIIYVSIFDVKRGET